LGLKKTLQDNLSLSSKLFLRGLLPSFISGRFKRKKFFLATPALSAGDLDLTAKLAETKPAGVDEPRNITTSIIIPVFNQAEFTYQCIQSLSHEIDFNEVEVIVVDNASTDETKNVLAHFQNVVHVIRNSENRGFVDACNQGAAVARGKYLVFLNNDTVVLPGWLKHLVETIEANPANGAVGSMFLYADGSIQEAGGIVWKNGEAHHYGWGSSPNDLQFNFAREVDYCSAASLLVMRDIFERLGGFDRRFAPAYYEDVDLCFGVRSLGYKVIYQPLSRLVHFESVTAGSDTTKGVKRFQIVNREQFVEKWRDVLEREHLPKNLKLVQAASNRKRNQIVVFDERIPSPDRDAGSLRMFLILKTLTEWSHVIFVPFNRPQSIDYERALWKEGIETADAVDYRRLLKNNAVLAAIVSRPSMANTFLRRIRCLNPAVGIVFDMVDTHFIRFQREHEISGEAFSLSEAKRYRKLETKLAQASDLVWCASIEDKRVMETVTDTPIEVVPTIHELRDCGKPFAEREHLLFIGNLAHRPNEDAVLFFMREIYPLVLKLLPNVRLDIIGDYASAAVSAYNSEKVRIPGYVPDVEPYLRGRRVFIAPLRFGAGVKGKVGEAMAHGIPVVTTTIGAEGFGLTHGLDVMIGDEPQAFADAIQQLYLQEDLWQRVSHNGRIRIEKHFTPEVISEIINSSIKQVSRKFERGERAGATPTFPTSS
jgi:GT2 family glycosyltransferase